MIMIVNVELDLSTLFMDLPQRKRDDFIENAFDNLDIEVQRKIIGRYLWIAKDDVIKKELNDRGYLVVTKAE